MSNTRKDDFVGFIPMRLNDEHLTPWDGTPPTTVAINVGVLRNLAVVRGTMTVERDHRPYVVQYVKCRICRGYHDRLEDEEAPTEVHRSHCPLYVTH